MATAHERPSLAALRELEPSASRLHSIEPNNASASDLLLLGLQQARAGEFEQASKTIAQAVIKDPSSADAHEALATVLLALGNLEYAVKAKAKAVGLGYNSGSDWELLGDMFAALEQPVDAMQAFQTALILSPPSSELEEKLRGAAARSDVSRPALSDLEQSEAAPLEALPAGVSPEWRTVTLVTIAPLNDPHVAAFSDLVTAFKSALTSLGLTVRVRINGFAPDGINLLFGAHLIASQALADSIGRNTVLVNLEQIAGFNAAARPVYASLIRRLPVWDYSARNIAQIRAITGNPNVCRFAIGYVPELTRQRPALRHTTDVLFYGSLNGRRNAILAALKQAGLNVRHLFSVYGSERDAAIADAKVVLNLHFYEDSIHEIVRTSYLLANSKAVVTECGPRTEIDDDLREAMVCVPYEEIVQSCVALINDETRRRDLERRGYEIFAKRDQSKLLRDAIAETVLPASGQ
jgi:Flp pilus assembly protein TadD